MRGWPLFYTAFFPKKPMPWKKFLLSEVKGEASSLAIGLLLIFKENEEMWNNILGKNGLSE